MTTTTLNRPDTKPTSIYIYRMGLEAYDECKHPNAAIKMGAAFEAMKRLEAMDFPQKPE